MDPPTIVAIGPSHSFVPNRSNGDWLTGAVELPVGMETLHQCILTP
jgi:hypothetical protein